jgi:YesN/AraC family two-component response regulator
MLMMRLLSFHAATGKEAISIFEDRTNKKEFIDVVITDYAMPEATGSDVIDHVIKEESDADNCR